MPQLPSVAPPPESRAPPATARDVMSAVLARVPLSRNVDAEFRVRRTFGERLSDRLAEIGGSWGFVIGFLLVLAAWIVVNAIVLAPRRAAFDPYPFILLNLMLSTIAALQAPVIMMSQNRQASRDRLAAQHDYEVNLKAEVEIRALHDKLDALREAQWAELVRMQQDQLRILTDVLAALRAAPGRETPAPAPAPEPSG